MRRRIAYLLLVAVFAQLSTGCCLLRRVAWRIRSCHGCYPAFNNPGAGAPILDGPAFGGAGYGGPVGGADCATCTSGYGADYGTTMPAGYPNATVGYPAMPGVTVPSPPSVGLPMPAEKDVKKN
jgi:hypothetical protein